MKKILVSLLLLSVMLLNVVVLAACTDDNGGYTALDLTGTYDGSAVTITFWHTMGIDNKAALDAAIARFNEQYPNIKVDHKSLGDYDEVYSQIQTKLKAGTYPNIAYCYPDHVASYNDARKVVVLDDLINNKNVISSTNEMMGFTQAQLDDFIEGYYNEGKEYGDNKMYSLPFMKSTEVLYYNKTVFAELGLEAPKTWEDVENCIIKLKEAYPNSTPLGYDSLENFFITLAAQHGSDYTSATGDYYIFNNDTNKAFVKKFAEWYQKGWLTSPNPQQSGYTSDAFTAANDADKKVFMAIGSSAGARYQRPDKNGEGEYPFDVGIVPVPQVNPADPKVISQGPSICILKKDNVQEVYASWLFVKFLTTDAKFQATYSTKSGYIPVIKSVINDPEYKAYIDLADGGDFITSLVAKVALEQEAAYFTSPAFSGSANARTQVGLLTWAVFTNYSMNASDATNNQMIDTMFDQQEAECEKNN